MTQNATCSFTLLSVPTTAMAWLALGAAPGAASAQAVSLSASDLPAAVQSELRGGLDEYDVAETPLGARRLGQRAATMARTILNANGYFSPTINTQVDVGPPPRPILTITPGPRFTVASIEIDYGDSPPRADAQSAVTSALTLATGDAALPIRVVAQERLIVEALRQSGYPDAVLVERRTIGNRDNGTLDIRYAVRTGPPVILGQVLFNTSETIRQSFMNRFVPFPPGTPYAPGEIDTLKRRLAQDRLFRSVQVTLDRDQVRQAPSGAEVRDVTVTLASRARNRVAAGASFATNEGAGIRLRYDRRDVSKRADTVRTELAVADLRSSLDITWDRPHEFGFGRDLELSATFSDEDTDGFQRQSSALAAVVEHTVNPDFALSYGINADLVSETVNLDTQSTDAVSRDLQILGLVGGVRLDRSDDALDPTKGWRIDGGAEPSLIEGDVNAGLLRLLGQVRAYQPLSVDRRVVAAFRVRAGSVLGGSFADINAENRFFGGGGGSVRGYAFQSIGPEDADGDPVGGQSLLEVSAEMRWRIGDALGVVAFLDGGRVSQGPDLSFDEMRYGAGVGLRYQTVAGPIRLDIATPVDRRDDDDPVQLYLSVGQAF